MPKSSTKSDMTAKLTKAVKATRKFAQGARETAQAVDDLAIIKGRYKKPESFHALAEQIEAIAATMVSMLASHIAKQKRAGITRRETPAKPSAKKSVAKKSRNPRLKKAQ